METNNVIMGSEVYEAPESQVINLEIESTILNSSGSEGSTGQATHDRFVDENYVW